jgi:hypothetical protein
MAVSEAPTSPGTPNADNTLALTNVSGSTVTNHPLRFARVFAEGEIADAPQVLLDGTPVDTQADVKTRWTDTTVKHCIMSLIVPSMTDDAPIEITFQNQASPDNTAITKASMLADYDFNAGISIVGPGSVTRTASARTMLSNDDYEVWCSGPIATTIILCDHAAGAYDMTWSGVPVRPIVHATFWADSHTVDMTVIFEQASAEHLGDIIGDVTITKLDQAVLDRNCA